MKDILVTGGTGQLGAALQGLPWRDGIGLSAPPRAVLDLTDIRALDAWLSARRFAAIVNAGAYTAVDRAEGEVANAWLANAVAPAVLAAHARRMDAPILHVSSDYVFDGAKPTPYAESDPVAPLGVYGASKEGGEQAVRVSGARHVIVRTSWVFSAHGANFLKTMLRLGAERPELQVVDDQRGAPTCADDLAAAVQTILLRHLGDPAAATGTYHFSNAGETTWCGFARHIFACAATRGRPAPRVIAISTADYPTPARRPANSRLDLTRIRRDFGLAPRAWEQATDDVVARLLR